MQVSIDTACSSAMVAVHIATQNLAKRTGVALAGGVNLMLAEYTTGAAFVAGMLTSDGRCKTLDAAGNGYVRAEACVVLRLDTISQAEAGENALVLLAGSHVNQVRVHIFARPPGITKQTMN